MTEFCPTANMSSTALTDERPTICFKMNKMAESVYRNTFLTVEDHLAAARGKMTYSVPDYIPIWVVTKGRVNLMTPKISSVLEDSARGCRLAMEAPTILKIDENRNGEMREAHYLTYRFTLPLGAQDVMADQLRPEASIELCGEYRVGRFTKVPDSDVSDSFLKTLRKYKPGWQVQMSDFHLKHGDKVYPYQSFGPLAGFSSYAIP